MGEGKNLMRPNDRVFKATLLNIQLSSLRTTQG